MDEHIEAVQRMQDYITEHLDREISMGELAKAANYSPWYSYRLFRDLLGMTPAVYIRRLRLSRSALRLRDEKVKIIDVAYDSGFESVDGYQRAFYREFGCNPYEYSVYPVPICLFKPYGIKYGKRKDRKEMTEVKSIFVQIIEKPARKVILKRGKTAKEYFTYCQEVGCDVWGLLCSIKSISGEPVCMWLPDRYIPEGFDIIELPKCQYMMFRGETFAEENFEEAIVQMWDAIKKYDPEPMGYRWDPTNPRIQLEPIGTRGYIELLPVKAL